MSVYRGSRVRNGTLVSVDSYSLPHIVRHSPDGFEWGYGGSGPSDLALSILTHHLGEEPPAWLYQAFKFETVAQWRSPSWEITSDEVDRIVAKIRERHDATE